MTNVARASELAAIKQRQQATWASGDYHMIGTQILIVWRSPRLPVACAR